MLVLWRPLPWLLVLMLSETVVVVFLAILHYAVPGDITPQSPLFGSSELGKPFDDGTSTVTPPCVGLHSLSIAYGPQFVFSIQATYLLQNGGKFSGDIHGTVNPVLARNSTIVQFQDKEKIVHISGTVKQTYGFITMLKLYTNDSKGYIKVYGPFGIEGSSCDTPFTLAGYVTGLFGRSDKYLNALGAYINPLETPMYNRTEMIGGVFGLSFDDYPALSSGHADMLNITINSGAYVFGLSITYRFPDGKLFIGSHGLLNSNSIDVIRFSNGERIVQTDLAIFSLFVNYLAFSTLDSKGVRRIYGPFGDVPQSNITTIHGTVYGFHGRVGVDHTITALTGLGFYT